MALVRNPQRIESNSMRPIFLPRTGDVEGWDGLLTRVAAMLLIAFWILVGMSIRAAWELLTW